MPLESLLEPDFFFLVLPIKLKTLSMPGKCSVTEQHLRPREHALLYLRHFSPPMAATGPLLETPQLS